jgi:hypothetical protein
MAHVPLMIPEEHYPAMVAELGRLLADGPHGGQSAREPGEAPSDVEFALRQYHVLSPPAQRMMNYFATRPGQRILGRQVDSDLGISSQGVLSGITRRLKQQLGPEGTGWLNRTGHGWQPLLHLDTDNAQGGLAVYWMEPSIAEALRALGSTD